MVVGLVGILCQIYRNMNHNHSEMLQLTIKIALLGRPGLNSSRLPKRITVKTKMSVIFPAPSKKICRHINGLLSVLENSF